MATSVTTSLPLWLAGATYDANGGSDLRNSGIVPVFFNSGVSSGSSVSTLHGGVVGGTGLGVTPGTGMNVTVGPGSFAVPVTGSPQSGGYASTLPQSATLAVQAADPANPRVDLVCATVVDNGDSTSDGIVQYIAGTAAPSPAAPALPANSTPLATVSVPANATSVTSGSITDKRVFTVAAGGVLAAPKGAVAGYAGQLAYDKASGSFYHNSAAGAAQAKVLPWAPQYTTRNSNWNIPTSAGTLLQLSITTDGSTDIKVTTHIAGLFQNTPDTSQTQFQVWLDGNQLTEIDLMTNAGDNAGISHLGFTDVYETGSPSGDTPSAGSHTVFWKAVTFSSHTTTVRATAARNAYLRVEPVVL